MICVFGSFVINDPLRLLDVFGLGLATAIFVDATLVRMVLVPSVMQVLGRANWWMPTWLDRILPTLGVEVVAPAPPPSGGSRPGTEGDTVPAGSAVIVSAADIGSD
jgi:RND superfamily putative drug exporter